MKIEYAFAIFFLLLITCIVSSVTFEEMYNTENPVPCYDRHNNQIEGLVCYKREFNTFGFIIFSITLGWFLLIIVPKLLRVR